MQSNSETKALYYYSNPFYRNQVNTSCPNALCYVSSRKNVSNDHTRMLMDNIYSRVYHNPTYATGQVILDLDTRNTLTDGQHFAWRCSEWDKIESNHPPSKYRDRALLESFMDIDPIMQEGYKEALIQYYLYNQNHLSLGNERIVAIDSSFLTKHYTTHFMHLILTQNRDQNGDIDMERPTTIFVETYLPIVESLFKVNNSTRVDYQNIEFNKVENYIQYSKARLQNEVGLKIQCSRYEVHQEMKKREDDFFKQTGDYSGYGGKWETGIRNMINDHVIIEMLLNTSKKIPSSVPIIATNDRGMLRYAHKKGVRFITTLDNDIFSSNYPLIGFRQSSIYDYIHI